MTCIVGLVDNSKMFIGGDSAGVADYDLQIRANEKVFQQGSFLMGFTTSFRMGQLLRYKFTPPQHPYESDGKLMDVYKYMVTVFIDAVRECLKNGGYARKESEKEVGGTFLVAYQGRLFAIQDDYQVAETVDDFITVGCGGQIANGALFATKGQPPEQRIRLALEAAERYSAGVRGPFHVLSI